MRNHKAGILQLSKNFRANYFSNFAPSQSREFIWLNVFVRPGSSLCFAVLAKKSLVTCRRNSMGGSFPCLSDAKHPYKCVGLSKSHLSGQESWVCWLQVWTQTDFKCKGMNGGWQSFPPVPFVTTSEHSHPTQHCIFRN